jgi:carbonic anhydrase
MKRYIDAIPVMLLAAGLAAFAEKAAAADAAAWSYTGNTGPAKWWKLSKEFALCGTGTMQSPIDIADKDVRKGDLPALLFNYKPSPLRVIDDGHTLQVNYAPDSWVTVNGKRYELVTIEFHRSTPARRTRSSRRY